MSFLNGFTDSANWSELLRAWKRLNQVLFENRRTAVCSKSRSKYYSSLQLSEGNSLSFETWVSCWRISSKNCIERCNSALRCRATKCFLWITQWISTSPEISFFICAMEPRCFPTTAGALSVAQCSVQVCIPHWNLFFLHRRSSLTNREYPSSTNTFLF